MRITKSQLKKIVQEELNEADYHSMLPPGYRKPSIEALAISILRVIEANVVEGRPVPPRAIEMITEYAERIRDAAREDSL